MNVSEYNKDENKGYYYSDGVLLATLDFNLDEFEPIEEMSESDEEIYYSQMTKTKKDFKYNESMMTTNYN